MALPTGEEVSAQAQRTLEMPTVSVKGQHHEMKLEKGSGACHSSKSLDVVLWRLPEGNKELLEHCEKKRDKAKSEFRKPLCSSSMEM